MGSEACHESTPLTWPQLKPAQEALHLTPCPVVLGATLEDCTCVVWGVGEAPLLTGRGNVIGDPRPRGRERTRGVRPGVGLCLETRDNGEYLRGSSSWEEKVGISVHCVPSHWQSPGHPVLLSVAPRKSPSLTCRCHFCLEPGSRRRLASLTRVITGLGSISIQNSHPSLSWCQI